MEMVLERQLGELCREVGRQIGRDVESVERLPGGYTPQVIVRLRLLGGEPAILKAAPPPALTTAEQIDWTTMLRREIAVYRDLGFLAPWRPDVYGSGTFDGWVWLLLEDLSDARRVPPWDDAAVDAVARALAGIHRSLADPASAPPWLRRDPAPEPVFERVRGAGRRVGDLPAFARGAVWWRWWEAASPIGTEALARLYRGPERSVNHVDTRADNIFLREGHARFIDWAYARLSYPSLDSVYWALGVEVDGFGSAAAVHETYARYNADVTDDEVRGALAFFAGYFVACLQGADSPALVQALRVRYLAPTLTWFATALGLPSLPLTASEGT
jgi:hypothetical protein